jgi:superfamily II DNA/RNA helicase
MRLLSQPVDILVATPGRLLDHMAAGRLDYSRLEVLVLDEADRMLDMGFIHAVEKIAAATPAKRQTLLFSATLEGNVAKLAHKLLKHPKRIQVASVQERHENIDQRLYHVRDGDHKRRLLAHLLDDHQVEKVIVFTATKHGADRLAKALHAQGHPAAALHGNMNQNQRNRAIAKLRSGEAELLVATDVAARGLDVTGISHVINYDLPKQPEDYVHRIGRTGRAGAKGLAISFVTSEERRQLRDIERYTKHSIPVAVVEGLAAHAPLGSGSRHRSTASVPGGERPHTAHAPARAGQGHPQQRAAHPRQGQPRREAHHAPRPAHHNANPGNQAQAPQHPKSGAPKRRKDGARRGASNFQQRLDTRPLFG